jgi:hypothetical protein
VCSECARRAHRDARLLATVVVIAKISGGGDVEVDLADTAVCLSTEDVEASEDPAPITIHTEAGILWCSPGAVVFIKRAEGNA